MMKTRDTYQVPLIRVRCLRYEQCILSTGVDATIDQVGDEFEYDDLTNHA